MNIKSISRKASQAISKNKDNITLITALASIVIAVMTTILTTKKSEQALQRMEEETRLSNKPIVLLTQSKILDDYSLTIWNTGPGLAYNVEISIHLAKCDQDIGAGFAINIIKAIYELETKTDDKIEAYEAELPYGSRVIIPPNLLPSGFEYGYHTSIFDYPVMEGIFIQINYNDALDNCYYSVWDGKEWFFGTKNDGKKFDNFNRDQKVIRNYIFGTTDDLKSSKEANILKNIMYQIPFKTWLTNESLFLDSLSKLDSR